MEARTATKVADELVVTLGVVTTSKVLLGVFRIVYYALAKGIWFVDEVVNVAKNRQLKKIVLKDINKVPNGNLHILASDILIGATISSSRF
jgi:hypothetical protein